MKIVNGVSGSIDQRNSMYPSRSDKVNDVHFSTEPYSTLYGFVLSGETILPNGWKVKSKEYFCYSSKNKTETVEVNGSCVITTRLGYIGQNSLGGPIEKSGRLCYMDGCSDSLLIYPPRSGDPSMSLLFFPPDTNQTFHIHPSIRLGIVVDGKGQACLSRESFSLSTGDIFCVEERENHRFQTTDSSMTLIAFHPDGDWGPTDQNHTMLNRTYVINK